MALVVPAHPSTITGTVKNQYTFGTFDIKCMLDFLALCNRFVSRSVVSAPHFEINGLLAMGVFNCKC